MPHVREVIFELSSLHSNLALPQAKLNAKADAQAAFDPTREYVSQGGFFSLQVAQVLSALWSDDAELAAGTDVYERMLTDPEVLKDMTVINDGIVGDGAELYAFYTDEKTDAAKAAAAARYSEFCHFNLYETLRHPFLETLGAALLDARTFGHKAVEQTYRDFIDETGAPRLVLDKLKCKSRAAVQFAVDEYFNVLGLVAWRAGTRRLIPRDKFFIPTFNRKDEDPRGRSLYLRAAFNWWQAKRAGLPVTVKRIEKKALPSIAGFTSDKGDDTVQEVDDLGRPIGEPKTSAQVMAEKIAQFESMSAAAFPNGASIQVVDASGDGSEFSRFFDLCDKQITRAILLQDLATNEGKHGTRAQATTHMDVLALHIWSLKNIVAECVRTDILKPLVLYNFGPDAVALTPVVSLGDTERRDWATDARAAALLGPLVPDSVWAAICQQLGLPTPEEGEQWPERKKQSAGSSNPASDEDAQQQGDNGGAQMSIAEGRALHANLASALRAVKRLMPTGELN